MTDHSTQLPGLRLGPVARFALWWQRPKKTREEKLVEEFDKLKSRGDTPAAFIKGMHGTVEVLSTPGPDGKWRIYNGTKKGRGVITDQIVELAACRELVS